jgi:prepilin-type N-terminal cleavage/methylation domain-containing protein
MNSVRGFSLIELAMVLFIVSLLLGGLLMPLATQLDARKRGEAQEQLERIREALIGFTILNGRLPCHTTESDPANINYGLEDAVTCNPSENTPGWVGDGILPWKTLGLDNGLDPWGSQRTTSGDPWTGYWRYRVHDNFSTTPVSLLTDPSSSNKLCVVDANGNLIISTSENPVAIVYSTGVNQVPDGQNASYEATSMSTDCINNTPIIYQGSTPSSNFDDITIWLTRPLLFNRMVSAGVLP